MTQNLALTMLLAAIALSIAYGLTYLPREDSLNRSILKTAPVGLLAVGMLVSGLNPLLGLGLAACATGDWFLSKEGEKPFLMGLGAFLLGHLLYIGHFSSGLAPESFFTTDMGFLAIILLALAGSVILRIWPHTGEMRIPVLAYSAVIVAMAFTARAAMPGQLVLAGVALFLVSDILLAQDKFTPLTNGFFRKAMPWLVWYLYAAGQVLIVYGTLAASGIIPSPI